MAEAAIDKGCYGTVRNYDTVRLNIGKKVWYGITYGIFGEVRYVTELRYYFCRTVPYSFRSAMLALKTNLQFTLAYKIRYVTDPFAVKDVTRRKVNIMFCDCGQRWFSIVDSFSKSAANSFPISVFKLL